MVAARRTDWGPALGGDGVVHYNSLPDVNYAFGVAESKRAGQRCRAPGYVLTSSHLLICKDSACFRCMPNTAGVVMSCAMPLHDSLLPTSQRHNGAESLLDLACACVLLQRSVLQRRWSQSRLS